MKKCILLFALFFGYLAVSQTDIDRILDIGIDNAHTFSQAYFEPAGESLVNIMSNGWYTSGKTKKLWHFEVGIVGNLSFIRKDKRSFILDTREYTDVTFQDGQTRREVANAVGVNSEDVVVVINQGQVSQLEVVLPNGIGDSEVKSLPSGFIQASVGLIKSTEIKVRFLPKISAVKGSKIRLYGVAFQHEFTDWVFPLKRWPVRLSGLLGYTNVKGFYDIDANANQEVTVNTNSWLLSGVVSTKLPVLNFYGGLGYYFGSSRAKVLGVYQAQNLSGIEETIVDPINVKNKGRGIKATFGTEVKFGVFKANMDYSFQNYRNLSLGLKFGW